MKHFLLITCCALYLLGCSNSTDVAVTQTGNPTKISLVVKSDTTAALPSKKRLPQKASASRLQESVTITSAKMVILDAVLQGNIEELEIFAEGPFVVDLPLDGGSIILGTFEQPLEGTYIQAGLSIDPLAAEYGSVYNNNPELQDLSFFIQGYLNNDSSASFSFKSATDIWHVKEFAEPINYTNGDSINIMFEFNVDSWFRSQEGLYIDPRQLINKEMIEENINNSLEIYEGIEWPDQQKGFYTREIKHL